MTDVDSKFCDCNDCIYSDAPCRMDCERESLCVGCAEALEEEKDREFEERQAFGG